LGTHVYVSIDFYL